MQAKQKSYLVQLRDQMADTFSLEDLQGIVLALHMDPEELKGKRKTSRIQDLIIQLARQGRLEELVQLLDQERPNETWPDVPSPEQQQRDIRTAFPRKPFYKKAWFWGIATVVIAIIGISITAQSFGRLPRAVVAAIPTDTPVPTPTHTPTPSPTPLPFLPAAEDETLIVVATFYRAEGLLQNAEVHNEIRRAIQANIEELGLADTVMVKVEPTILRTENRDEAEALGNQYNATLIIWGEETSIRLEVNFLNLKEPDFDAAEATISETEKNQIASIANPDAYTAFVLEELPGQLSFLSLFALGQTEYSRNNYEVAITLIETAVAALPNSVLEKASELGLDDAYFRLGWLYQYGDQPVKAIADYDQAIRLNPENAVGYINRGVAYDDLGEYEQAIADYDQAIRLNPEDAVAYNNRGVAYSELEEYKPAIADFNQAIRLNPKDKAAYYNRGKAYYELGEYRPAIADYD